MARIDAYVQQLFERQAIDLLFETGQRAALHAAHGTSLQLTRQPLLASQILDLFEEVLPAEARATYPAEGVTNFSYSSPAGPVEVELEIKVGLVRGIIRSKDASAPKTAAPAAPGVPPASKSPTAVSVTRSAARVGGPPPPSEARGAMEDLLTRMISRRASDLHLNSGSPPMLRIDGDMRFEMHERGIEPERMRELLFAITPERNRVQFEETKDTDFGYENERARFRVNLFEDRNGIGAVVRLVPSRIPSAEELGLPPAVLELCTLKKGLVLVTGPSGAGKSTTLAAMIDYMNKSREDHIITIEDPIEFVHQSHRCVVNQREVGVNTSSFQAALRAALREDPDVVLVGELRDLETMSTALETAETGHLVLGTLHTTTAPTTIDRVIDQFSADRQAQIRLMLADSLRGVIAQTLCRRIGGGRALAMELLLASSAVATLIREAKTYQIPAVMQTSRQIGMLTLNEALFELVKKRVIDPAEALLHSMQKPELKAMLERAGFRATLSAVA